MNIVLSAESEARNATQSGVTSKLLAEGKYAQALRDALLRNDSHQILSILSQIPYKKPKALEGLSLPETFKLITIFKDVVEEGANAPFFAVSLFWLYETLVRFECFVGSISPCRSPSSSANNIMSIANNDESIKTIRTEAKRILQELSRDSGFEDGLIVALFESFSIYYQRNVLSNIPSIVGGSTQQEDSALSERKLRLTNRLILSLQVELDKLLNDDY
ncbi:hypothetical protein DI09_99p110 [Mitosporidium daphniae]|uniref:Uncharacterized protein n=1 Tax=Mitosporidium daphniae TaxID=1485682 RepID=A0A098VQI0_9MICR|nr:uncharacterized protein DI09_99p110 [Mitosporidium daphniae]KGG49966.1 hypothetical protein DI09_99p110 [Mitosporidium daphniae]|eukprot:XP_013236402.1 uncharacterized protein DI09_99p110 [Mitosporidium daphniae]